MSTFTQFNGPQSSGTSTKDLLALIEAYNNLSAKLAAHVEAVVPEDTTVHGVAAGLKKLQSQFNEALAAKADCNTLNDLTEKVRDKVGSEQFNSTIKALNELVADKTDKKALDAKADVSVTDNMSANLSKLTEALDKLKAAWSKYASIYTEDAESNSLIFDCSIRAAEYLIGRVKAFDFIDFTRWSDVAAQFAGTGSSANDTNGLYILGELSSDWDGMHKDADRPEGRHAVKSGRVYVKYVNSNPFDSIVDFTATYSEDGWAGNIVQQTSRALGSWLNLSYHLIHSTDKKGNDRVYLAVSADGLAKDNSNYANLHFYVCGVNFVPLNDTDRVQGVTSAFATDNIDSALTQGISANKTIDFVDWVKVTAQYATNTDASNTGLPIPNADNDHFILGKLSKVFKENTAVSADPFVKQCMVYVKHTGKAPFEATVNCTVEKTLDENGDVKWKGTVHPVVSRGDGKWRNVTFALELADNYNSDEDVYLSVSADGLTKTSAEIEPLVCYVCGVNFRPLGLSTSDTAPTKVTTFAKYNYDRMVFGSGEEDGIYFTSRPIASIFDPDDPEAVSSPLATLYDVQSTNVQVGGIIDWPRYETKTKQQVIDEGLEDRYREHYGELWDEILDYSTIVSRFAVDVPKGYAACDGSSFDNAEFPELALVLTDMKLPVKDMAIIRTEFYESTLVSNPDVAEVLTTERLNQKIDEETNARKEADQLEYEARAAADEAITKRLEEEEIKSAAADELLDEAIKQEAAERADADSRLESRLDTETSRLDKRIDDANSDAGEIRAALKAEAASREYNDAALGKRIDDEASERAKNDQELGERVDREFAALNTRATGIEERLTEETELRRNADSKLEDKLDTETARLDERVDAEAKARKEADNALDERIDSEAKARKEADSTLDERLSEESKARKEADFELDDKIAEESRSRRNADDELSERIDDEARARANSDEALADSIETETVERIAAVSAEKEARELADSNEKQAREQADKALGLRIDAEETARKDADDKEAYAREKGITEEAEARRAADERATEAIEKAAELAVHADKNAEANVKDIARVENSQFLANAAYIRLQARVGVLEGYHAEAGNEAPKERGVLDFRLKATTGMVMSPRDENPLNETWSDWSFETQVNNYMTQYNAPQDIKTAFSTFNTKLNSFQIDRELAELYGKWYDWLLINTPISDKILAYFNWNAATFAANDVDVSDILY